MKRVFFLLVTLALCAGPAVRAQDAATQERLDKLTGRIEDLENSRDSMRKRVDELAKEVAAVREQSAKPNTSYARPEDLNQLGEKIKEVDRKRIDDADKIHTELLKLRKALEMPISQPKKSAVSVPKETPVTPVPTTPEQGFEYVIKSGDTLGAIVQAYKEKNIKVTVKGIEKANPGLKADRLIVGQKIFIPAPQQ